MTTVCSSGIGPLSVDFLNIEKDLEEIRGSGVYCIHMLHVLTGGEIL
jgi:hypothetical protein